MSQPYVDGITDTVPHQFASSLTAGQIAVGEDTVSVSVVCPDRWFLGDFAVVTSRDGRAFAGEVEGMDVCTGEITIRGAGQLTARATSLRGLRGLRGPGQRRRCPLAVINDHRPPAHLVVLGRSPGGNQPSRSETDTAQRP
jgi:hypothetical protein